MAADEKQTTNDAKTTAAEVRELQTPVWVYVVAAAATALVWSPWWKQIPDWELAEWLPNVLGFVLVFGVVSFPLIEWLYWALVEPPKGLRPYPILGNVLIISGKELRSYFSGALAYVVVFFLLGFSGLIFVFITIWGPRPEASMAGVLSNLVFLTLMVAPLLTMGTLAQERASGTIELLMTRPVRDSEVVLGKFLAMTVLYLGIIALTGVFALFVGIYGNPDWGPVVSGYLGLVLAGLAFLALGMLASSLVASQVAAAVIGYCFLLVVWLIGVIHYLTKGTVAEVARDVSVLEHVRQMAEGTIDSRSIIFLLSITVFALFMTIRALENRRTI